MSAPVRVLVVDDSAVMRRLLTMALDSHPGVEVVGEAEDGVAALAKVESLDPDVVTLDVEMPGMNGLETLEAMRRLRPRLPVIMCSTLTERAAITTLDALTLGAADYVTKPSAGDGSGDALRRLRDDLLPKVLVWSHRRAAAEASRPAPTAPAHRAELVVIGISTGGPTALEAVLSGLPAELPVPVLVVQHMPPVFTRILARRLDARLPLGVAEAEEGARPLPGEVWIAQGGRHLEVRAQGGAPVLTLTDAAPEHSCRPAVDRLFASAADGFGRAVLAVVLTGMGRDGLRGAEAVRARGGGVVVQDRATSLVWGMPGAVAEAGLADAVLPLRDIAEEIARRVAVRAGASR